MISVIAHGNRCQFNSYENCLYMFGDVFTLELLFFFFKHSKLDKSLETLLFFYLFIIYSCNAKLNFQHNYSSLQCHMILKKLF